MATATATQTPTPPAPKLIVVRDREQAIGKARDARRRLETRSREQDGDRFAYLRRAHD